MGKPMQKANNQNVCSDPIVGAILSGWRYDISNISPEMRTDYETHLAECAHCRGRQRLARTIDILLLSVTTLSFAAFLLVAVVLHKLEALTLLPGSLTFHLHQTPIAVSLMAVATAGLLLSMILSVLVAIATPIPGLISNVVRNRIQPDLRERLARRHTA